MTHIICWGALSQLTFVIFGFSSVCGYFWRCFSPQKYRVSAPCSPEDNYSTTSSRPIHWLKISVTDTGGRGSGSTTVAARTFSEKTALNLQRRAKEKAAFQEHHINQGKSETEGRGGGGELPVGQEALCDCQAPR